MMTPTVSCAVRPLLVSVTVHWKVADATSQSANPVRLNCVDAVFVGLAVMRVSPLMRAHAYVNGPVPPTTEQVLPTGFDVVLMSAPASALKNTNTDRHVPASLTYTS